MCDTEMRLPSNFFLKWLRWGKFDLSKRADLPFTGGRGHVSLWGILRSPGGYARVPPSPCLDGKPPLPPPEWK